MIYFRYAEHPRLFAVDHKDVEKVYLHPELGFETFINEIFSVIESVGKGACYAFDCLSELAVDWSSDRMLGTGLIDGKSVGMLMARAILRKKDPQWNDILEPHDSFFIGSDVFYTFLVQNGCWWIRRKNKDLDTLLESVEQARLMIHAGEFPKYILEQFKEMLNYFGQVPIIVRSSSLLEDNYGNSFSGKYESVFCTNQGTPEERLEAFVNAARTVYASTMDKEALVYREKRGLLDHDEQMAQCYMGEKR